VFLLPFPSPLQYKKRKRVPVKKKKAKNKYPDLIQRPEIGCESQSVHKSNGRKFLKT
jgi:hypothetical protein